MKFLLRPFFVLRPFYEWMTRYPLLVAVTAGFMAILAGFDGGMGLRLLFLDPKNEHQFLAGFTAAALLFEICFVGYLLDSDESWMLPEKASAKTISLFRRAYLAVTVGTLVALAIWLAGVGNANGWSTKFTTGLITGIVILSVLGFVLGNWIEGLYFAKIQPKWRKRKAAADESNSPMACVVKAVNWLLHFPNEERLHSVHLRGLLFAVVLFLLYLTLIVARPAWVTSAVAICVLLGLIAAIYGFIRYHFSKRFFGIYLALAVVVILLNGVNPFVHRFAGFKQEHYDNPRSLKEASKPNPKLISDLKALEKWKETVQEHPASTDAEQADLTKNPKLIIVSASGGGIRAGVWTVNILTSLEEQINDFPHHLRLITGASGGMYGASYYVQTLNPPGSDAPHKVSLSEIVSRIAEDSLNDVAQEFVLSDIPHFLIGNTTRNSDRGTALETAWHKHTRINAGDSPQGFAIPFSELADGERAGWRPSLVMSPMMADDGRRLLISNLDLTEVTRAKEFRFKGDAISSVNAIEFFKLFPDVEIPLSTAVRMNASFPYISPVGVLPTAPERRIVDAGYYDNFGVNLATAWLFEHRDWLALHTSGVLLIQICDTNGDEYRRDPARTPSAVDGQVSRGLSWLTTPVTAVLAARNSTNSFRNDEELQVLRQVLQNSRTLAWKDLKKDGTKQELTDEEKKDVRSFFFTPSLELDEVVSLSWTLTPGEIEKIAHSAERDDIKNQIMEIDQWLHEK